MNRQTKAERKQEAIAHLKQHMKPGMAVYTVVHAVSRSGMSRTLSAYTVNVEKGRAVIHNWNYWVANALEWSMKGDYLRVSGCGMDMGFHTVYELADVLYGDGYKLKQVWL